MSDDLRKAKKKKGKQIDKARRLTHLRDDVNECAIGSQTYAYWIGGDWSRRHLQEGWPKQRPGSGRQTLDPQRRRSKAGHGDHAGRQSGLGMGQATNHGAMWRVSKAGVRAAEWAGAKQKESGCGKWIGKSNADSTAHSLAGLTECCHRAMHLMLSVW